MATEVDILDSLYVGHSFANREEFLDLENNLREVGFMPTIWKDSPNIKPRNEKA